MWLIGIDCWRGKSFLKNHKIFLLFRPCNSSNNASTKNNCYALFRIYCFIAVQMRELNCVENTIEKCHRIAYNANNLKELIWKTIKIFNLCCCVFIQANSCAVTVARVAAFAIIPGPINQKLENCVRFHPN